MRIKKITSQNRRDFYADYECEECGNVETSSGYDDRYFHDEVIPKMKCKKCGLSRDDMGITAKRTATRYPEGFQI